MDVTWRKSSYSGGNGGGCIEVGAHSATGRVLVRDTKDRQGPALSFGPQTWRHFSDQVKADAHRCRFPVISSNYLGSFPQDFQLEILRGR
jgi:hypothetical protein